MVFPCFGALANPFSHLAWPSKAPKTWAFLYSLFTMSTGARLSRAKETAVSHLGPLRQRWWTAPWKLGKIETPGNWVWVNTYRYIFSGMNIHLPAILGFTRYQGFDPSPIRKTSPGNPIFVFFLDPFFPENAMDLMDDITWILMGNHVDD